MRFSCNGCRVLRKGCGEDCSIRPCLRWIKSPEAQANATLFLAKFYGRAGLLNLINAGPDHLRPSIFKSLLQEACGRILNPIYGSSGLISTGGWHLCEAAVEAVLSGLPITQISIESAVDKNPPFKACDIRHVTKKAKETPEELKKIKNRTRFKRSKPTTTKKVEPAEKVMELSGVDSVSHDDSGLSHSDSGSVENVEDTLAKPNGLGKFGLVLTLGFDKAQGSGTVVEKDGSDETSWKCELTLGLPESLIAQ